MRSLRSLFCAALLCGLCLTVSCVPVSAADESATMLYNGVELPVFLYNETDYPKALIHQSVETLGYFYWIIDSNSDLVVSNDGTKLDCTNLVRKMYRLDNGRWVLSSTDSYDFVSFGIGNRIEIIWTNFDLFFSNGSIYLPASAPVDPNASTGSMTIESSQILDDSASFVLMFSDLDFSDGSYTVKYTLSSGGTEIRSTVSDVLTDSSVGLHLTSTDLTPETEYEVSFILQKDGVDTSITASTTFTTAAATADTVPDYTQQLDDIQGSIDDVETAVGDVETAVNNVQTAVDGVTSAVDQVGEEVKGLPQKILDGIVGLFVPSQEDLTAIRDEYETMLSDKLGFVWQAFDLLTTAVEELSNNLESGDAHEFNFPGVILPMQGEEFVLVPESAVSLDNGLMDVLRPVLGTIVSIVCVLAFVNMGHDYVLAIVSGVSAYQFERRGKGE